MGFEKSMAILKSKCKPRFTKGNDMSKCKLNIDGTTYICDTEKAMQLFELMNSARLEKLDYDYVSHSESPTGKSQSLYYLKPMGGEVKLEGLDPEEYAMWKLYTSTRGDKK
jgi:hypothetical protein